MRLSIWRAIPRVTITLLILAISCGVSTMVAASGSTSDASTSSTETSIYTYNLPGSVNDCIGLYPKPGCGTKPVLSGDRGGAMQYATMGTIFAGLILIMTVIARSVIRTDRAKALPTSEKSNN